MWLEFRRVIFRSVFFAMFLRTLMKRGMGSTLPAWGCFSSSELCAIMKRANLLCSYRVFLGHCDLAPCTADCQLPSTAQPGEYNASSDKADPFRSVLHQTRKAFPNRRFSPCGEYQTQNHVIGRKQSILNSHKMQQHVF